MVELGAYTVVNIDGSASVDLERAADHWFFDARIAESEQVGEELYQRNSLDRGHLVRRLDPVWGPDSARANEDTFHFTNCSPQHEKFNQGKDLWQGLENYILENAQALDRRITVFTGPVTEDTDPIYKGVRLPLAFWKIIAYRRSDATLATAAYVLEQGALIQEILSRAVTFDPGTYRLPIADLDARTGLDFAAHELPLSSGGIERAVGHIRVAENYTNLAL